MTDAARELERHRIALADAFRFHRTLTMDELVVWAAKFYTWQAEFRAESDEYQRAIQTMLTEIPKAVEAAEAAAVASAAARESALQARIDAALAILADESVTDDVLGGRLRAALEPAPETPAALSGDTTVADR